MKRLEQVLGPFRISGDIALGPLGTGQKPPRINKKQLQQALVDAQKHNLAWFCGAVAMVVTLFIVDVVVVVLNTTQTGLVGVVNGIFGTSAVGLIAWMVWLWREKSRMNLFCALVTVMDADTVQTMINLYLGGPKQPLASGPS
jgi:hypothetical protein